MPWSSNECIGSSDCDSSSSSSNIQQQQQNSNDDDDDDDSSSRSNNSKHGKEQRVRYTKTWVNTYPEFSLWDKKRHSWIRRKGSIEWIKSTL